MAADSVSVEVSVECDDWLAFCPSAAALAATAAQAALSGAAKTPARRPIVGVTLTDDERQRQLNLTYRGTDAPTNVLAFALGDEDLAAPAGAEVLLGDVVLAFATLAREAVQQQKPLADHLQHLVVHGVLHLLGFDHQETGEATLMEAREIEILASLGVPDPYRDTI